MDARLLTRRRGHQVTRLEAFTDAAFAFALTLLVIAVGDAPTTPAALRESLLVVPAFVAASAIIILFWRGHYEWSRRYGLETSGAVALSMLLVLGVLVFVYPLRMVALGFFGWVSGGVLGGDVVLAGPREVSALFVTYGTGYAYLSLVLAAHHALALRHSAALGLTPGERLEARLSVREWLLGGGIALASVGLALFTAGSRHPAVIAAPGGLYFLVGVFNYWHALDAQRRRRQPFDS